MKTIVNLRKNFNQNSKYIFLKKNQNKVRYIKKTNKPLMKDYSNKKRNKFIYLMNKILEHNYKF